MSHYLQSPFFFDSYVYQTDRLTDNRLSTPKYHYASQVTQNLKTYVSGNKQNQALRLFPRH